MKKLTIIGVFVCVLIAIVFVKYKPNYDRLTFITTAFSGVEQYEYFNRMKDIFPVTTMKASSAPYELKEGIKISLPKKFSFEGEEFNVEDFLTHTDTGALLVLHKGEVVFERYSLTGGRDVNWLSMSVAKSVISTAIGIAVDEGLIDIQKPITDYVTSLNGSAYENVRIKDILQMSSGIEWREDYADSESEVMQLGRIMAVGGSMDEFIGNLKRKYEPGTVNHYVSGDTQALGMLLTAATNTSITDYVERKLWIPLGMETNGYWMKDDHNMEMAFGGLNATARDYAKLGELYRLKGNWQGKQIVSTQWVQDSVTPDAPHLQPYTKQPYTDEISSFGYGYQWWIPASTEGDYSAIGVYNQFIYVNPTRDIVIVKLSAFSDYSLKNEDGYFLEEESIELFRAISKLL